MRCPLAVAVVAALAGAGCIEERDGRVELELSFPCLPSQAELEAKIDLYCLRVTRGGDLLAGPTCARDLDSASLVLPESITPVRIGLTVHDREGGLLLRGSSPEVSLVSGRDARVPLALAPTEGFGLVFGPAPCTPLPHPIAGHTASLFPSGHLLVLGSSREEVNAQHAGLLLDPYAQTAAELGTPGSGFRSQHAASLLDDGTLLVVGGILSQTLPAEATREILILQAGSALGEGYQGDLDYPSVVGLSVLQTHLIYPRPLADASVFFGDELLVVDGKHAPEILLGGGQSAAELDLNGLGDPLPLDGRTFRVAPFAPDKALVPGLGDGRVLRLILEDGISQGLAQVVSGSALARDLPRVVPLPDERVLVLGGLSGVSASEEGPAAVWGNDGSMLPVAVPEDFPVRGFSATRLLDGRVLVAGGLGQTNTSASAATFLLAPDQDGGFRVERGPPLHIPRMEHSASLLPDGRLIVAGGEDLADATSDPAWSVEVLATGSL